jgi:hypothetical protein
MAVDQTQEDRWCEECGELGWEGVCPACRALATEAVPPGAECSGSRGLTVARAGRRRVPDEPAGAREAVDPHRPHRAR